MSVKCERDVTMNGREITERRLWERKQSKKEETLQQLDGLLIPPFNLD